MMEGRKGWMYSREKGVGRLPAMRRQDLYCRERCERRREIERGEGTVRKEALGGETSAISVAVSDSMDPLILHIARCLRTEIEAWIYFNFVLPYFSLPTSITTDRPEIVVFNNYKSYIAASASSTKVHCRNYRSMFWCLLVPNLSRYGYTQKWSTPHVYCRTYAPNLSAQSPNNDNRAC